MNDQISIITVYQHSPKRLPLLAPMTRSLGADRLNFHLLEVGPACHADLITEQIDCGNYRYLQTLGPFNRGQAFNLAVKEYWPVLGDLLVLTDADLLFPENYLQVVQDCSSQAPLCGWSQIQLLSETLTAKYLETGRLPLPEDCGYWYMNAHPMGAAGGVLIVPKSVFVDVCGFPSFSGWGAEDNAMWLKLCAFGHSFRMLDAQLYHMYHPSPVFGELGEFFSDGTSAVLQMASWTKEQWLERSSDILGEHVQTRTGRERVRVQSPQRDAEEVRCKNC